MHRGANIAGALAAAALSMALAAGQPEPALAEETGAGETVVTVTRRPAAPDDGNMRRTVDVGAADACPGGTYPKTADALGAATVALAAACAAAAHAARAASARRPENVADSGDA